MEVYDGQSVGVMLWTVTKVVVGLREIKPVPKAKATIYPDRLNKI